MWTFIVKLIEGSNNKALDEACWPAGGQKLLRLWTPSRRHGKGGAELLLGRKSAHRGSTGRSPASWSPTSCWKLKHTHTRVDNNTHKSEVSPWVVSWTNLQQTVEYMRRCSSFLVSVLPSHSLLVMVLLSCPLEQIEISLSTLVTLALRPPSSPPPSVFVSEDDCEDGPSGAGSPSKNTSGWPWILSAEAVEEEEGREKRQGQTEGEEEGKRLIDWPPYWDRCSYLANKTASCCVLTRYISRESTEKQQ